MEDFLLIEMPAFKPEYKKWIKYGYNNPIEKNNLKDALEESTGGYCMYCYSRIRVDHKLFAHLEHAIEKNNSNKLIECIPNMGLSCAVCNQTFKRIGERKRKIPQKTIEKYEKRIPIAREKFRRAGREEQITILIGDAAEHLKQLAGPFDFIFMDAAKGQYIHFLPDVLRLLEPGGILVSDNVLQDGDLIESRFAVERRNRTIHSRMREYLYELKHNPQLVTSILPLGDGVTLSVKQ